MNNYNIGDKVNVKFTTEKEKWIYGYIIDTDKNVRLLKSEIVTLSSDEYLIEKLSGIYQIYKIDDRYNNITIKKHVTEEFLLWQSLINENELFKAKVIYADLDYFIYKINEFEFRYNHGHVVWNYFQILFLGNLLKDNSEIHLKYSYWNFTNNLPVSNNYFEVIEKNNTLKVKLIYIRQNTIKRKKWCRDVLYFIDDNQRLYRTLLTNIYDINEKFKIDNSYEIVTGEYNKFTKVSECELVEGRYFYKKNEKKYTKDEIIKCRVTLVLPYGLRCVSSNDEQIYVYKTEIIKENNLKLNYIFSPGDIILVEFISKEENKDIQAKFYKLEERIFINDEITELLDLKAEYKKGINYGFKRDNEFRNKTLEYYDNTCALCGIKNKFNEISSMEAAHIIPRSSRGANSIENSLCLCREHHWSFDKGLWTINENGSILLSELYLKDTYFSKYYIKYQGKNIDENILSKISSVAITWHRNNIFKLN